MNVHVVIYPFSFLGHELVMANVLQNADLFYMSGVEADSVPTGLAEAMQSGILMNLLQCYVQYDQCAYFGVCGGAILAGKTNPYTLPGFNFLDGISIRYDSSISAKNCPLATSVEHRVMQITTGCAVSVLITEEHQVATCFSCIKNHTSWSGHASRTTELLQAYVEDVSNQWTRYIAEDGNVWFVNLRGFVVQANSMQICRNGIWQRVPFP